jgi:hypothetical protein
VRPSSKAAARVSTPLDKTFQLVQVALGRIKLEAIDKGQAYTLKMEVSRWGADGDRANSELGIWGIALWAQRDPQATSCTV